MKVKLGVDMGGFTKSCVCGLFALLISSASAMSQNWEASCKALAGSKWEPGFSGIGIAYDAIDTEKAIPACERAVTQDGSVQNLYRLSRALIKGKKYKQAFVPANQAANMNYAPAQVVLAIVYSEKNTDFKTDFKKAVFWGEEAAKTGYVPGIALLGWLYHKGIGVSENPARAVFWYRIAAGQGHAPAQLNLGYMYETGTGVARDLTQAAKWYQKAADQANKAAAMAVARVAKLSRQSNRGTVKKTATFQITLPPGLTSQQIVARLNRNLTLTGTIFSTPAEGTLLPDTYTVASGTSRQVLLDLMAKAQGKVLKEAWNARAPGLPFKQPGEALILASMVEKGTGRTSEYRRLAAVFINRLNKSMRLMSDAAVIYGINGGKGELGRGLGRADFQAPTPYNTYKIFGLPPTPIANPSRAAIKAVLNPLVSDELFFVADGSGGLVFAKTLAEHIKNLAKFRGEQKKQGIAAVAQAPKPSRPVTVEEYNKIKAFTAERLEELQKKLANNRKKISTTKRLKRALEAMREKDYARAIADLEPLANNGNAIAQSSLGTLYRNGQGVARDYSQAVKWYQKAAGQGNAVAQFNLALSYSNGQGVARDYSQAFKWYQKAAKQGNAAAQLNLGVAYGNGRGVGRDHKQAAKWFRKAAVQGNAVAQFNLALNYDDGKGVAQDYSEAVKWYRKSADQGYAAAQLNLGVRYVNGQGVARDYSEAAKWYRKAAVQGDSLAQFNLALRYEAGQGVVQDYSEAVRWYRKAADQGYAAAQLNLGFRYSKGEGVEQDYYQAVKWYRKAAVQGNAVAQFNLGVRYGKGKGVAQDHSEAVKWYRKAADQGYASAQYNLALGYDNGQGVARDYRQAIRWYRKAAEQGIALAQFNLGIKLLYGRGIEKDYIEAHMLFNLAVSSGYKKASKALKAAEQKMTRGQVRKARERAREWQVRFAAKNRK